MFLSPVEWLLSCMAITLGSVLQAATGLGAGLVIVPLLALIDPALTPGPVLFASLGLTCMMAWRGREQINTRNFGSLLAGIGFGATLGGWLMTRIRLVDLGVVFGLLILVAVAISLTRFRIRHSHGNAVLTGAISTAMGVTAGVGAPLLALYYQHEEGPRLRATLAFLYCIATLIMLFALNQFGRFDGHDAHLGLSLIPGFLIGYCLAGPLAAALDADYSRAVVCMLAGISALTMIVRGIG